MTSWVSLSVVVALAAGCASGCTGPAGSPDAGTGTAPGPTRAAMPDAVGGGASAITGLFDIGDRELALRCTGGGSPTVVLDGGEGEGADSMEGVRAALAGRMRACAYDRANVGDSGSAPVPRSATDVVADLHSLLAAAGVPGPYLLVGHSAGAVFAQLYARRFAGEVAGVVALNPIPPWDMHVDRDFPLMSPAEQAEQTAYYSGKNTEGLDYRASSAQVAEAPAPTGIPFEMLISTIAQCESPVGVCARTYPVYEQEMRDVAAGWSPAGFTEIDAGRSIHGDDPDAVVAAVGRVLAAAPGATDDPGGR